MELPQLLRTAAKEKAKVPAVASGAGAMAPSPYAAGKGRTVWFPTSAGDSLVRVKSVWGGDRAELRACIVGMDKSVGLKSDARGEGARGKASDETLDLTIRDSLSLHSIPSSLFTRSSKPMPLPLAAPCPTRQSREPTVGGWPTASRFLSERAFALPLSRSR